MIFAGVAVVAVVSEVISVALNPYWASTVFASPATAVNLWLPPFLTLASTTFPLSSLNLISNEFSSPLYT